MTDDCLWLKQMSRMNWHSSKMFCFCLGESSIYSASFHCDSLSLVRVAKKKFLGKWDNIKLSWTVERVWVCIEYSGTELWLRSKRTYVIFSPWFVGEGTFLQKNSYQWVILYQQNQFEWISILNKKKSSVRAIKHTS